MGIAGLATRMPTAESSTARSSLVERTVRTRTTFPVSGGTALERSAVANVTLETAVTATQSFRSSSSNSLLSGMVPGW